MKKVLITGFDPFDKEPVNPAFEAIKGVDISKFDAEIIKLEIPTVSYKGLNKVIDKINEVNPDIVINVGQAGGRFGVMPERIGINLQDYRIKDNEGNQPLSSKISEDGENAHFSTIPVKAIVRDLKSNTIPSALSYSAGTFVCNEVMYGVLEYINKNNLNIKAGFVHIPFMTEQVLDKKNMPSLSLDQLTKAMEVIISSCLNNDKDIKDVSGEIS